MAITKEQIDRIKVLSSKARAEGLTSEEKAEQQQLRKEYVASFRENLTSQLDNIRIVDKDGSLQPAVKKCPNKLMQ